VKLKYAGDRSPNLSNKKHRLGWTHSFTFQQSSSGDRSSCKSL